MFCSCVYHFDANTCIPLLHMGSRFIRSLVGFISFFLRQASYRPTFHIPAHAPESFAFASLEFW